MDIEKLLGEHVDWSEILFDIFFQEFTFKLATYEGKKEELLGIRKMLELKIEKGDFQRRFEEEIKMLISCFFQFLNDNELWIDYGEAELIEELVDRLSTEYEGRNFYTLGLEHEILKLQKQIQTLKKKAQDLKAAGTKNKSK